MKKFKKALLSVSNKNGLDELSQFLNKQGTQIVSTGGTAKYIRNLGIEVIDVSEQTDFPEIMDGRVKTLHPKIHMALLARDNNEEDKETLKSFDVETFDLVVGNLYPFEEVLKKEGITEDQLVEHIDIGGPSFLRSAAKNFNRITVLCDPSDYRFIMEAEDISITERKRLSAKVFAHTSVYDSLIAKTFVESLGEKESPSECSLGGRKVSELRYGENPTQRASWFQTLGQENGLHKAKIIQGKALSYNNILDLDAAVETLRNFSSETACVSVKHLNPCGVGVGINSEQAIDRSLKADPVSVFGGIIAVNEKIDKNGAEILKKLFLECIVAPGYTEEAIQVFSTKKNLRVLEWPELKVPTSQTQFKTIDGGFLIQTQDKVSSWAENWKIIGEQKPNEAIIKAVNLSWSVCAHLKSNAIAIANSEMTLGLGMGQVNRIDAVEQAIKRYKKFHPQAENIVLSSDAFFPFADSIEQINDAGIKWVVQPAGSIKDEEVFECAKRNNMNLIITGQRHFCH